MRISARFARVEGEVQNSEAEDFLEEDFFGGECEDQYQHLPHPPVRVLSPFADLADRQTPFKTFDYQSKSRNLHWIYWYWKV